MGPELVGHFEGICKNRNKKKKNKKKKKNDDDDDGGGGGDDDDDDHYNLFHDRKQVDIPKFFMIVPS